MKRLFVPCLFMLATSAILLVSACKLYYTPPAKTEYSINASAAMEAEGKRLAMLMCAPCHYDSKTKQFSGKRMEDVPGFVGKIYSRNITQHPTKGIANYTDGELAFLIRTGISRDGKLMPFMQRPNLADQDLRAIIAFLHSKDDLVRPLDADPGRTQYTMLGKMGMSQSKPLAYPAKEIAKPSDKTELGKYLVDNLSCYDCHSKSFMSINKMFPEKSKGFMGGGNKLLDINGKTVLSRNLTFHETGIGSWSEQDLRRALTEGISKDNVVLAFPMPMFSDLKDEEVSAIYAYLKSIPAINNKVKRSR